MDLNQAIALNAALARDERGALSERDAEALGRKLRDYAPLSFALFKRIVEEFERRHPSRRWSA